MANRVNIISKFYKGKFKGDLEKALVDTGYEFWGEIPTERVEAYFHIHVTEQEMYLFAISRSQLDNEGLIFETTFLDEKLGRKIDWDFRNKFTDKTGIELKTPDERDRRYFSAVGPSILKKVYENDRDIDRIMSLSGNYKLGSSGEKN